MKRAFSMFLVTAAIAVSGAVSVGAQGAPSKQVPSQPSRQTGAADDPLTVAKRQIVDLTASIAKLEERLKKAETANLRLSFRVSALEDRNRTVSLDPATPRQYQRLDNDEAFFVVSLEDATPYLDGYKVIIRIGNLMSARYSGFSLQGTWGPRYDWDKYTDESYKKWEAQKQSKEFSFTNALLPGTWNRVELTLPSTAATQLGFLEISIKTDTVWMNTSGN